MGAEKARKKRPVVGDMKPMADTLKVIDDVIKGDEELKEKKLLVEKKSQMKRKKLSTKTPKQKKVQQQFLANLSVFNQVNKHPEYRSNPFKTISTHIENKMILEKMQNE